MVYCAFKKDQPESTKLKKSNTEIYLSQKVLVQIKEMTHPKAKNSDNTIRKEYFT
jgi:hypothetical protein